MSNIQSRLAGALLAALLACGSSCKVTEDYHRPAVDTPATFKSALPAEKPSAKLGWDWWRAFGDPELDRLEAASISANFDIQAAMARVAQARAATKVVASQFYPQITLDPSATRQRTSRNGLAGVSTTYSDIQVPFDLSYEVDIWGRVRKSVEAAKAQTQAAVDDLAVVRQTLAADIAQDYFTLRSLDAQDQIISRNVKLYRDQVNLTQTKFKTGLVGQTDVLQAQTLLDSTLAQEVDVRRQRTDLEHAIAILIGRPPSEVTLAAHPLNLTPPLIPAGLPAELLKRRPDVAEAEQNLIVAAAQVGVAKANFFPVIRLTGAAGFESIDVSKIFDWESRIWSIGPSATIPIFEGGQLNASLEQAKARYDEVLANYHTAVLQAIRDVEDSLTDLHLLADEDMAQSRAVNSSRETVRLTNDLYKQGLIDYLQVIDADRTLLTNELANQQVLNNRMAAAVLLMKALGGGWDAASPEMPIPTTQPATQPTSQPATRPATKPAR